MGKSDYKQAVHDRDKFCQTCGTYGDKLNPLTVHHKKPRCKGGSNSLDNLILLCSECHHDLHKKEGFPTGKVKRRKRHKRKH